MTAQPGAGSSVLRYAVRCVIGDVPSCGATREARVARLQDHGAAPTLQIISGPVEARSGDMSMNAIAEEDRPRQALLPAARSGAKGAVQMPASYADAKAALQRCSRVDECRDFADRAIALAVYANRPRTSSLKCWRDASAHALFAAPASY